MDNFEWSSGYFPQFGLYGVEPGTHRLLRRPSADVYRRIARVNGIPPDLRAQFPP